MQWGQENSPELLLGCRYSLTSSYCCLSDQFLFRINSEKSHNLKFAEHFYPLQKPNHKHVVSEQSIVWNVFPMCQTFGCVYWEVAVFITDKSLWEVLCFYFVAVMHRNNNTAAFSKTAVANQTNPSRVWPSTLERSHSNHTAAVLLSRWPSSPRLKPMASCRPWTFLHPAQ